jgi:hypothetical protein
MPQAANTYVAFRHKVSSRSVDGSAYL